MVNGEEVSLQNTVLGNWMSCFFYGSESFESVANKLVLSISSIITDYLEYIMEIPLMSLSIHVHKQSMVSIASLP